MTDRDANVDLLLHWKDDAGTRRDGGEDLITVGQHLELGGDGAVEGGGAELGVDPSSLKIIDEVPPEEEYGPEYFEWSEDREQALCDALEAAPEGAVATVHTQLEAIAKGLEGGTLPPDRARMLLREVDTYLQGRIKAENAKRPVEDGDFMQSRGDKLNALVAWQESASALREYLDTGEAVQLKVATYAAEQAHSFLTGSREVLMACEPELDDEPLEDEEEEYDDEDLEDEDFADEPEDEES